ncbi:MAG: ABC transporter ATP-binding protein [Pseudomonadota bacterium]
MQTFTWRHILEWALEHRAALARAHIVAILAAAVSIPLPILLPLLVDEVLLNQPGPLVHATQALFPEGWHGPVLYVVAVMILTLLLRLMALGLNVWQMRAFTEISKDVSFRLRGALLDRLGRVSMAEYESLGSGGAAARLNTDVETIDSFLGQTVARFLVNVLMLVGTAAVLLWLHWQLALIILLFNPLVILLTMKMGKRVKELKKRENKAFELFQQSLTETLEAIQQIRAANREKHYLTRVTELARGVKDHAIANAWQSDALNRLSFMVFLFGFDVFRAVAMLTVVFSDLSIGVMIGVFGYLWFMMGPVQELLNVQFSLYGAKAALGRLNALAALKQEPDYPAERNPFANRDTVAVSLRDVRFAYTDVTGAHRGSSGSGRDTGANPPEGGRSGMAGMQNDPPVLDGVNLDIAPGEKVALVGASGGGKSTLAQVLLGLYTPQAGQVLYDDVPIERIGLPTVREHVAVVLQQPTLFNDSVRANLTLGRTLSDEALWRALEIAELRDTVEAMPEGLDTVVGRQGVRLSGGQRQRLAIARMVLTEPAVVILDEATSMLDNATEARVHAKLREALAGRTVLIIAHRLSAVRQADRVLVFENGRIVEQGAHDDLLAQRGLYHKLYGHEAHPA